MAIACNPNHPGAPLHPGAMLRKEFMEPLGVSVEGLAMWKPMHDLAWSFHQGKLHELFLKDPITVATWVLAGLTALLVLANFLLVIATGFLWADSRSKGEEQRERWKREDEQHKQDREEERARWLRDDEIRQSELKPKYQFGLTLKDSGERLYHPRYGTGTQAALWVANLGLFGLYVDRLVVKHRDHSEAAFAVNQVVPVGGRIITDIPNTFWEDVPGVFGSRRPNYLYGDHEFWLVIADFTQEFETERVLYTLLYYERNLEELRLGSYEERQVTCPKCGSLLDLGLIPSGATKEAEVQGSFWKPTLHDLANSCPNHASPRLKSLGLAPPEWLTARMTGAIDAPASKDGLDA